MANYLLLYTGGAGMAGDPAEQEEIMAEWGAWYGQLGDAIVDGGAPFGQSKNLTENGVGEGPLGATPATGYTVIAADSLEAAVEASKDHPHLKHQGQVQVFECVDMTSDN